MTAFPGMPDIWPDLPLRPIVAAPGTVIPGIEQPQQGGAPPPALKLPPWTDIPLGGWSGSGPGPPAGTGQANGEDSVGTGDPVVLDGWGGPPPGPPAGTGLVEPPATTPTAPPPTDGESEADYLIRCAADVEAQGATPQEAETLCQAAWDAAQSARGARTAEPNHARQLRKRSAKPVKR